MTDQDIEKISKVMNETGVDSVTSCFINILWLFHFEKISIQKTPPNNQGRV